MPSKGRQPGRRSAGQRRRFGPGEAQVVCASAATVNPMFDGNFTGRALLNTGRTVVKRLDREEYTPAAHDVSHRRLDTTRAMQARKFFRTRALGRDKEQNGRR